MTWAAIGRAIWAKVWPLAAALALLAAFGLASIGLAKGFGAIGSGATWLNTGAHVPALLLVLSPLLLAMAIGLLNRSSRPGAARATAFREDRGWYDAGWRRDPDNPAHDLGTEGYRLELQGGPLAGRTARLRDSRFRLWVVQAADGSHAVTGTIEPPSALPAGARLLGSYGFSHGDEAMVWNDGA